MSDGLIALNAAQPPTLPSAKRKKIVKDHPRMILDRNGREYFIRIIRNAVSLPIVRRRLFVSLKHRQPQRASQKVSTEHRAAEHILQDRFAEDKYI